MAQLRRLGLQTDRWQLLLSVKPSPTDQMPNVHIPSHSESAGFWLAELPARQDSSVHVPYTTLESRVRCISQQVCAQMGT
jgi:hypothetical protein